jgi:AGZA family xanthine/uracil permease-like MFS transporter
MGLNAYFTYQVVGFHGTGPVPYRLALTAVFVEGFIFVFLSLIGMRQWLVKLIPASLKIATTAGIGLFLTLIGLSSSAGIGVISGASATPLDLAGCLPKYQDEFGACQSHKLQNPTVCHFPSIPCALYIPVFNQLDRSGSAYSAEGWLRHF